MKLTREQFEALVDQAVDDLPDWVGEHLNNIAIMVAPAPTQLQLEKARIQPNQMLLGLYEGIPLTKRSRGYHLAAPDRITLFQLTIESQVATPEQLVPLIRRIIVHEIGHHFGFNESELADLNV